MAALVGPPGQGDEPLHRSSPEVESPGGCRLPSLVASLPAAPLSSLFCLRLSIPTFLGQLLELLS